MSSILSGAAGELVGSGAEQVYVTCSSSVAMVKREVEGKHDIKILMYDSNSFLVCVLAF